MQACPWCKSTDIRYSVKKSNSLGKSTYHAAFYCWNCHCYGPRVLYKPEGKVPGHVTVERNEELKEQARLAWESR